MELLKKFFLIEIKKYHERGIMSIISLFLLYSYFYHLPIISLSLYSLLPQYSLYKLFVIGSFLIHLIVYILVNSFFFSLYYFENSKIKSWKVSKEPWPFSSDPLIKQKLFKVLKCFIINNLFVVLPISSIQGFNVKYLIKPEEFSSLWVNFIQILFFLLSEDLMFYWTHRLLHTPYLYKKFHKQHHEFNVSISVASEYAHPAEFLIGNIFPLGLGAFVLRIFNVRVHILTWFMWLCFRSIHTSEGHSGYNLPFSPFRFLPFGVSAKFHDDHHLKNVGNFGSMLVIWDSICGTNRDLKEKNS